MASQKMGFPETVITIQHFLVSVRFLCGGTILCSVCRCMLICMCSVNFPHFYVKVRAALDISRRKRSFSKTIPHHAPEPQRDEKITSSTSQRWILSGRINVVSFMWWLSFSWRKIAWACVCMCKSSLKWCAWRIKSTPIKNSWRKNLFDVADVQWDPTMYTVNCII